MADIDQLHATYYEASRALARGHWDALVTKLLKRFPAAVRFETTGSFDDIGGELSLHVTKVVDATDTVLWADGDDIGEPDDDDYTPGDVFENLLSEHLDWLGVLDADDYQGVHEHDLDSGYAYVKLVAVLRLSRHYRPDDIQAVLPPVNPFGEVMFVATDPGYNDEFDDLGADPTSWEPV